nr:ribonuclease H-like domain-containing protein [Tanacetum cinerariifolium]
MSVHNSVHNTLVNSDHEDDVEDHSPITRISKLDISDPLHLHPNDTTALTVISIKLKGTKNYQVWSCAMLLGFEGKNNIGFIDGSCKRSNTNEVLAKYTILSREVLPDVRSAYATMPSEESYRVSVGSIVGSSQRNQTSAFVSNVPNSQNFKRSNHNFSTTRPSRPNNLNNNRQGEGSGLNNKRQGGGANQHITYTDKELDNILDISHLKIKVGHHNRTEAYISKIGNLILSNGLPLCDVMVIPEYYITLISVDKLIKENKVIVVFDENRCYFLNQDLILKIVLGIGEQCEGLYYYIKNEEVVYMKPPEGYFPYDNKVCRLKKSLYGLKQALRQWNAKLTSTLIENGFNQNDIIITGNSICEIEKFKVYLMSKFMIKDLVKINYFLGTEVINTDKGICLNQRKYVLDFFSEYGMLACNPVKTLIMSKLIISNERSENDPLL